MTRRTEKEQRAIDLANDYQQGLGKLVERAIDNPNSGTRESIANTPIDEIKVERSNEK